MNNALLAILIIGVTIGIPAVLIVPMMKKAKRNRELRASGVTARATIVSISETGTRINHRPVCDIVLAIEPASAPRFQATARQVVGMVEIPQMQPGKIVTVHYDPKDPSAVVIGAFGHVAVSEADGHALIAESQRLLEDLNRPGAGVAAPAIVRAFTPTGVNVNGNNPLAHVQLKVMPVGGLPFDATLVGVFGEAGLHKYQPGCEVRVRYDAARPERVTMDRQATSIERSDPPAN